MPGGTYYYNNQYIFPEGSAPLYTVRFHFQSAASEDKAFSVESTFWLGMVITSNTKPKNFKFQRQDIFYTKKK